MKKYTIPVMETLYRDVVMEAETKKEAEDKVKKAWKDGEIVLSADDFREVNIGAIKWDGIVAPMTDEVQEAMTSLLEYSIIAEQRHYEESGKPRKHIYKDIAKVAEWYDRARSGEME